jgi:hypothetical protein
MLKVKRKHFDQNGFLPMLILILLVVAAIIYLVYTRVGHLQK